MDCDRAKETFLVRVPIDRLDDIVVGESTALNEDKAKFSAFVFTGEVNPSPSEGGRGGTKPASEEACAIIEGIEEIDD